MHKNEQAEDPGLADFRRAFDRVFRPSKESRMFGSPKPRHQGFSDDHDGVQWNAGVDRTRGVVTVGVNLEGKEYAGWPIARFIEAERASPSVPAFARSYEHSASTELWFSRDAWQVSFRPDILEQHFGPEPPVYLRDLSDALWQAMLKEAYECLDESRGYRGRARQIVTRSRGEREMPVSPHIQIKVVVRDSVNLLDLDDPFETARQRLQPVRELLQRLSQL